MSVAIENFVKTIYKNDNNDSNDTKPGNIAKKLGISNAAATDMAKKLATKDLLNYEKYKALELTEKGKKMALNVIRKHRLWESLLYKMFDMSLHEIHREAELLEHETSSFLANKISEYLGNPKFDPHGDPIPDKSGNITHHKDNMLSSIPIGKLCTVIGVKDSSKAFLNSLDNSNIKLGSTLKVISKEEFDNSIIIEMNKTSISISNQISKNLFVTIK